MLNSRKSVVKKDREIRCNNWGDELGLGVGLGLNQEFRMVVMWENGDFFLNSIGEEL
jgi:hypothetical protein